jgi:hypothetical protein
MTLSIFPVAGSGSGVSSLRKPVTFVVSNDQGVGDYTTIADAISNLPAEGGLIAVREGTYILASTINLPDKSVKIVGCGMGTTVLSMPAFVGPMFKVSDGLTAFRRYEISGFSAVGGGVAGQEFWRFDDANGRGDCVACSISISGIETFVNWTKYDETYSRQSNIWIDYSQVTPLSAGAILVKAAHPGGTFAGAIGLRSSNTLWSEPGVYPPAPWSGDADCDIWISYSQASPNLLVGTKFNGIMFRACLFWCQGNGDVKFFGNGWDTWDFIDGASSISPNVPSFPQDTDTRIVFGGGNPKLTGLVSYGVSLSFEEEPDISGYHGFGNFGANPFVEFTSTGGGSFDGMFSSISGIGTCLKLSGAKNVRISATFLGLVAGQNTVVETGAADNNIGTGCIGLSTGAGMTIIGANSRFVTGTGINLA